MSQADLAATVDAAWEGRESISPNTKGKWRDAVEAALDGLDDGSLRVAGDLEIHGETRKVEASGRFAQLGEDAYGKARVGLSIESTVDRRDFGLDWQAELPSGGEVLDYAVTISVDLELVGEEA